MQACEISIKPQKYIKFLYGVGMSIATIQINSSVLYKYSFQLRTNNPSKYLVSQSMKIINQSPFFIKISLNSSRNLHKRLSDRFQLLIKDANKRCIITHHLKILIQQYNKKTTNIQSSHNYDKTNIIDEAVINSTLPSIGNILSQKSNLKKTSTIRRKFIESTTNLAKQQIHQLSCENKFNQSVIILHQKRKKIEELIYKNQKNNASTIFSYLEWRFQLYLSIFVVLLAFFIGFLSRKQCRVHLQFCQNISI